MLLQAFRASAMRIPHWFWRLLSIFALGFSVLKVLTLWYLTARPDPDFLAFTASVVQIISIVSLFGISTEAGRKLLTSLFQPTINWLMRHSIVFRATMLVGIATVLALIQNPGLGFVADALARRGVDARQNGENGQAIRDLKLAISFVPDRGVYHFDLGRAYEATHAYEQAIQEYQTAIERDGDVHDAANNLGRLYLTARKDPDAALDVLFAARESALAKDAPLWEIAIIQKNIAWALHEKGLTQRGLLQIDETLAAVESMHEKFDEDRRQLILAEAYRLKGAMLSALPDNKEDTRTTWRESLRNASAYANAFCYSRSLSALPTECTDVFRWIEEANNYVR